jgi:putative transposase
MRVWENRRKGRGLYGARKVWLQLRREGIEVARCTVERLMRGMGITGVAARRKKPRTTVPAGAGFRPADLLERDFTAPAPNRRWVADITYVATACGFVYTAFITELISCKIVGWQVADHLRAGLAVDALEMAIFARRDDLSDQLAHHSDRGVQLESIRYTERLGDNARRPAWATTCSPVLPSALHPNSRGADARLACFWCRACLPQAR